MIRSRPLSLLTGAVAIALVALVVAGCGGGDDQATAASAPKSSSGGSATVGVASAGGLGKVIVDSKGRTAYLFKKDTGPKSTCFGACAVDWPPITTTGKPTTGAGLNSSLVGTTMRSDGKTQVTYNGHPLYLYVGDAKPGDTNGQNVDAFGAKWYVLSPAGNQVTKSSSSSQGYSY